jgi:triosephosphate isomerase
LSYLIVANWKMNKTNIESLSLINDIKYSIEKFTNVNIVLCPPFTSLVTAHNALEDSKISLGSQNIHFESEGAFTGEISADMISPFCKYVILGHSERRILFNETNSIVNMKIRKAIEYKLTPIICIGENINQRNNGDFVYVIESMLESSLVDIDNYENIVIAYEPLWAIGTDLAATPQEAEEACYIIRKTLSRIFDNGENLSNIPILYGGSVNTGNIRKFLEQDNINGALVGGASLNSNQFISIVQIANDL